MWCGVLWSGMVWYGIYIYMCVLYATVLRLVICYGLYLQYVKLILLYTPIGLTHFELYSCHDASYHNTLRVLYCMMQCCIICSYVIFCYILFH